MAKQIKKIQNSGKKFNFIAVITLVIGFVGGMFIEKYTKEPQINKEDVFLNERAIKIVQRMIDTKEPSEDGQIGVMGAIVQTAVTPQDKIANIDCKVYLRTIDKQKHIWFQE